MPKYVVRYGAMRILGVFTPPKGMTLRRSQRVIARTDRGQEIGEVLTEHSDQSQEHLGDSPRGQVVREFTEEDAAERARQEELEFKVFDRCEEFVKQLALQLDLVDVEYLFGGERIVIYFLAENRVDFRELVRLLGQEFNSRIEMRQIGVRDEAKLLADYGDCGKPVCCNTHLSEMPPVSMKMAKLQKATLDPSKISGRCGRLKCCLRYEYDTYEELRKELPPVGSEVLISKGRAKVLAQEILSSQLMVETEDHRRILISATEVLTVVSRKGKKDDKETLE